MEHLIINDEEVSAIQDFVSNEYSKKGYASIADLPFGSIPKQNYELSVTALYSAVYIAVLKQQYQLNGKILTHDESGVDIVTLLKNYCQENASCTVADVMDKAVELVGAQNRQNSFAALYDTMICVDKEHFVSDVQVQFDVDQIDYVLQDIIGDRFAPIKSVTTSVWRTYSDSGILSEACSHDGKSGILQCRYHGSQHGSGRYRAGCRHMLHLGRNRSYEQKSRNFVRTEVAGGFCPLLRRVLG